MSMRRLLLLACVAMAASQAKAVIVRGKVTSPLGVPLPGARVQLIQGPRSIADTIAGPDGDYEIRIDASGRFLLLTAPPLLAGNYAPQVGTPFYAGRADLIRIDITLNHAGITPQVSTEPTLLPTNPKQLATPLTQVAHDELLTHVGPAWPLRATPGEVLVQQGQWGSPSFLYLRGAPPQTLLTTVNGVTANPLGSAFDLSKLSSTTLGSISPEPALEVSPAANPLYFTGASGGVLAVQSTRAFTERPTLVYTGDAGGLDALRNEAVATYAHRRYDLLGAFSRFDLANSVPAAPYHLITWAADAGYHISAGTSLRATGRYDESAAALSSPFELFGISPNGKQAGQNVLGSATFETRTVKDWHNLVRYGVARERGQTYDFATPATGLPVAVRGANGYVASGTALFDPLPAREDAVTNRDEGTWQTDYPVKPWLKALGDFRFQDERAADRLPEAKSVLGRTHYSIAGAFQGGLRERFFYEASGFVDHSNLLGWTGSPRLGLTYAPVRPGLKKFRGTSLHATLATGTREPSLLEQAAMPSGLQTPRSRTFDASVDQNILAQKLTLRGTYFHSQFSHEFEPIGLSAIASQPLLSQTLALRTQGFESDLRYQPKQRILLEAGYNHLASLTERSAETASLSPNLPGVAIGALSALAGQRPFHRPAQSGFFLAEYIGKRLNASISGTAVSRADGSTALVQSPSLLLPNRNLDPRYTSMDAHVSFAVTKRITAITQLTNLTDDRHTVPIGYLATPFVFRAGLRVRLGGE